MLERSYYQDGNTGSYRLQSHSPEDQLTTTCRQYTIVKIPEPEGEAEACSWATENKKDHISRVRGVVPLLSLPEPAQHRAERAPMGLQFLHWETENPKWTSSPLSIVGHFLGSPLGSYLTGITGGISRA